MQNHVKHCTVCGDTASISEFNNYYNNGVKISCDNVFCNTNVIVMVRYASIYKPKRVLTDKLKQLLIKEAVKHWNELSINKPKFVNDINKTYTFLSSFTVNEKNRHQYL